MKILVTGGSGFIGKYFLDEISKDPRCEIFLATRNGTGEIRGGAVRPVRLDLAGDFELDIPVDIVFHLAGEKKDERLMEAVNVEGTGRLLKWAASMKVKKFVYLSSVGVYGAPKDSGRITEESPRSPKNRYEETKNEAELMVRETCAAKKISFTVIQPSNVIGAVPGGKAYPFLGLMRAINKGLFFFVGNVQSEFNYIGVEDVASSLAKARESVFDNRVFIVNTPVKLCEAVKIISTELGVPMPEKKIPKLAAKAAAALGSRLRGTGVSLPFDVERYSELTNTTIYDGSAILGTGFTYPLGIEASLKALARLYVAGGLL